MRQASPRISVCIPVYNGGIYIAEAIESVLGQTFQDFRLIIADNCSTDNTSEIVRKFHDPRITYTRGTRNIGLVGNANRCLKLAEGDYVCIFHHDDVMLPENLERKIRLLDEHPEVGFVHSNLIVIDQDGKVVADHIWCNDSRRDYIEAGLVRFQKFLDLIHWGSSIFIGTIVARRNCYEHIGNFRTELPHCSDSEMCMRMMLFYNVACIGTPLLRYRVHPASTTSNFGDYNSIDYLREHFRAVQMIFENYEYRIPEAGASKKKAKQAFAERAMSLACSAYDAGHAANGRKFMDEARAISPEVKWTTLFWKTAARRVASPIAARFLLGTAQKIQGL
jgi:glycosyltransferase involved in cell wall biosynthesis